MTTETISQREVDLLIVEVLKNVKNIVKNTIELEHEDQQRFILQYIQSLCKDKEEVACIPKVCAELLEQYPTGMPHDSTLIDEAKKRVGYPLSKVFPQTLFDEDVLMYKMAMVLVNQAFETIPKETLNRGDQVAVENLERLARNTLVDNPNFKGDNSYYKRHYYEMERAKKGWIEFIEEEFTNWIGYFQQEA